MGVWHGKELLFASFATKNAPKLGVKRTPTTKLVVNIYFKIGVRKGHNDVGSIASIVNVVVEM